MDVKKTGELIAQKRRDLGFTQNELAQKLGVTNKAVSKWETGEGFPDISIIPNVASELKISVEELLAGEKNSQLAPRSDEEFNKKENFKHKVNTGKILLSIIAIIFSSKAFLGNITSIFSYLISNGNVFSEGNWIYALIIILNFLINAWFWGAASGISIFALFTAIGKKSELIKLCNITMFLSCIISILGGIFLFITEAGTSPLSQRFLMLLISLIIFTKLKNGEDVIFKIFNILIILIFVFTFIVYVKMMVTGTIGERLAGYSYLTSNLEMFIFWLAIIKVIEKNGK